MGWGIVFKHKIKRKTFQKHNYVDELLFFSPNVQTPNLQERRFAMNFVHSVLKIWVQLLKAIPHLIKASVYPGFPLCPAFTVQGIS